MQNVVVGDMATADLGVMIPLRKMALLGIQSLQCTAYSATQGGTKAGQGEATAWACHGAHRPAQDPGTVKDLMRRAFDRTQTSC